MAKNKSCAKAASSSPPEHPSDSAERLSIIRIARSRLLQRPLAGLNSRNLCLGRGGDAYTHLYLFRTDLEMIIAAGLPPTFTSDVSFLLMKSSQRVRAFFYIRRYRALIGWLGAVAFLYVLIWIVYTAPTRQTLVRRVVAISHPVPGVTFVASLDSNRMAPNSDHNLHLELIRGRVFSEGYSGLHSFPGGNSRELCSMAIFEWALPTVNGFNGSAQRRIDIPDSHGCNSSECADQRFGFERGQRKCTGSP